VSHEDPELTKFDLRQVPHTLDTNQMEERVTLLYQRLQVLPLDEKHNFRNIGTGDAF
jgi:hypothetical protein